MDFLIKPNERILNFSGPWSVQVPVVVRFDKVNDKIRARFPNIVFNSDSPKECFLESEINDENFRPSYNVTLVAYIIDNSSDNLGNLNISKEGKITISADLFGNKFKKGEGKFGFYNIEIEY